MTVNYDHNNDEDLRILFKTGALRVLIRKVTALAH